MNKIYDQKMQAMKQRGEIQALNWKAKWAAEDCYPERDKACFDWKPRETQA